MTSAAIDRDVLAALEELDEEDPEDADGNTATNRRTRDRHPHQLGHTEVVIGFDRPFVMIGERINPTGRKLLAEEMKNGDFSRVEADALAQVAAGAHMLDVNAGIPLADEPALLARAISWCRRSPTCRCRSTRRSSPRSRPASPCTRASRWSTR